MRPYDLYPRHTQEIYRQRIGDLIFYILGTASWPIGKDDALVLADIRNDVHVDIFQSEDAAEYHQEVKADDEETVSEAEFNKFVDHISPQRTQSAQRIGKIINDPLDAVF